MKHTLAYFLLLVFTTSGLIAQSEPKGIMWTGDNEVANAFVWHGVGHLMNIEWEKAYTYFDEAVRQDPTLFAPHFFLSRASSGEKKKHHKMMAEKLVADKNEASKLYVSLMETGPGEAGAEKRRAIWKKMHDLAPEGPFIHYMYARSLTDPKAQIMELEKLMANNEKNERNSDYIHNMLGYIHYAEGDKEKAMMHFKKYIELRPNGYNAYDSMADYYRQEGDHANARMYYEMTLEKYPYSTSARNRIEEIDATLSAQGMSVNLPEVFSATPVKVAEGHAPPEVTNNARKLNEGMKKHGKGIGYWVSYGDRGERQGKLALGFTFDLKENRDYYFPKADDNSDGANPQFEALMERMGDDGYAFTGGLTEQETGYTDYVCVGFDDLVDPQLGGLVAVRPLMVKAGSEADFEKFVSTELYLGFKNHLPGVQAYVYKGDRGEGKGAYIMLWSFDSVERRNGYFPSAEGDPSEAFMKANEKLAPLNEKLGTFLTEDMTAGPFTDYISIDVGS